MSGGVVAIVDNNIALLDSLKFALETEGYQVSSYSSPTLFLDDPTIRPACLIVDYDLPDMRGLDLVARIRQEGTHVPVLLLTGLLSSDVVARAAGLGVEAVLEKPADVDELLKFVGEYC